MKVLFLTYDHPFPIKYGGHVYTGNVARGIASRVEAFEAMAYRDDVTEPTVRTDEAADWTLFPKQKKSRLRQALSRLPVLAIDHKSRPFGDEVARKLDAMQPDVIVFDHIAMVWLIPVVQRYLQSRRGSGAKPITVYLSHNVETDLRRQIARNYDGNALLRTMARLDAEKAARAERQLVDFCSITTAETTEDADRFGELFGCDRTVIVTPGYDGHYVESRTIDESTPPDVVVLGGRLSLMKRLVLDQLLKDSADAVIDRGYGLHVVGPISDDYKAQVEQGHPRVVVHGFVDDVRPTLAKMRLGIIADHVGGGFKHRILTYVFNRVPIIAEPVAMAGVPLTPGEHYVPVDDYAAIPAAIDDIGSDFPRLQAMQDAAFTTCREYFSWDRTSEQFVAELRRRVEAPEQVAQ